jgi:hypothetical protein
MTTIAQWNKVDMTFEVQGVWDTIYTEDQLMPWLEFEGNIDGTSYDYERESVNPTAATVSDEGELVDGDIEFSEKSESLKTVYVQNYLNIKKQQTSRKQDPLVILKQKMAKSYGRKLSDLVINGDSAVNGLEFDGLEKKCRVESRMMAMDDGALDGPGDAETELTIARLREAIDQVEPGRPDVLIMNKTMRRKLTNLMNSAGSGISLPSIEMFGDRVKTFDDIPIVENDYISNSEQYADSGTWGSSTATTIYAAKFGQEKGGFTLLHNGGFFDVEFQDLGIRKNRNERVYRLIGYPGSVVYEPHSIIGLGGIDSAA